jgi:hypothetical protein
MVTDSDEEQLKEIDQLKTKGILHLGNLFDVHNARRRRLHGKKIVLDHTPFLESLDSFYGGNLYEHVAAAKIQCALRQKVIIAKAALHRSSLKSGVGSSINSVAPFYK